ncbi:MAG: hypothetical protein ABSG14_04080 [Verrucomicrobiia bacterium]|jgi:hypothetical protein
MKTAKRSQFFEVPVNLYGIEGEMVWVASVSICHLASFVKKWLRLGCFIRDQAGFAPRFGFDQGVYEVAPGAKFFSKAIAGMDA